MSKEKDSWCSEEKKRGSPERARSEEHQKRREMGKDTSAERLLSKQTFLQTSSFPCRFLCGNGCYETDKQPTIRLCQGVGALVCVCVCVCVYVGGWGGVGVGGRDLKGGCEQEGGKVCVCVYVCVCMCDCVSCVRECA